MTQQPGKFHSLSRKIVIWFCLFTLAISVTYGLISFILMYTLEDAFIEKDIRQEARYLIGQYQQQGQWPQARKDNMQLHFSKDTLPEDMRELAIAEPNRKEFYGDNGRHYHLMPLDHYPQVYLLAEVSNDLMVRPIREGVIQFLTVSALMITLIACFIAWLIGRKTARPLKQLAQLVDGVAPEHVPNAFATQFPNNEIGLLASTLEQSLQRMTQALEREKCFTRDVSHELRTPLAIIKNAIELQQVSSSEEQPNTAITQRILDAAEQMEKTVHTLLMLAREEHTAANKETVQLMPIVEQSVLDNRRLLEGKTLEIYISDNCHTQVNALPGMLKVLLDNLLSNAFQYTLEGEVSVNFDNGQLIVKDTGPGIDTNIQGQVTEPAVKGSQSTGFGFGLSIVKRLCEHQGWQMQVSSSQGTTVTVMLN